MLLSKEENKIKKNVLKILRNNKIKKAISLVAELKFQNKKIGMKKAHELCVLYIDQSVDFKNKPDNFNYLKEIENNLEQLI